MTDSDPRELCRSLLEAELPRRWAHSQGVARQAAGIGHALNGAGALVESAAWLHDIGYASPLALSASIRSMGRATCETTRSVIVACGRSSPTTRAHSSRRRAGARRPTCRRVPIGDVEAVLARGADLLRHDTSRRRDRDVKQRLEEILTRYPEDHVVHRAISSGAELRAQVDIVIATLSRGVTRPEGRSAEVGLARPAR